MQAEHTTDLPAWVARVCVVCGTHFMRTRWEVRKHGAPFCSVQCKRRGAKRSPLAERFWPKVSVHADGCWNWTASVDGGGYGQLSAGQGRTPHKAHRVSWELHFGPVPDSLWVLHRCDNPPCVRPDHLFLGTQADNNRDAWAKGRMAAPKPETPWPNARLTPDQASEIREIYSLGQVSLATLARSYGVSVSSIHNIVRGRTWRMPTAV